MVAYPKIGTEINCHKKPSKVVRIDESELRRDRINAETRLNHCNVSRHISVRPVAESVALVLTRKSYDLSVLTNVRVSTFKCISMTGQ